MQTPAICRILANEQRDWNFDMNAYIARMQESHKDAAEGDQGTETEGEEGEYGMECFPTMREDGMTIDKIFSKKHPKGPEDMTVETMGIKARVGWQGYKHALHTTASSIEQTSLKREQELKDLKKQLIQKNKIVKEIEAAKMSTKDIKLSAAWTMAINRKQEELINLVLKTVHKLGADYSYFLACQQVISALRPKITENLEKANKNFQVVQKLEKEASVSQDEGRMTFATQFYVHHDWLQGALRKYGYLAEMRAELEKEVRRRMDEFKVKIQFIQDDGYVRNIDEIVLETNNLLHELLRLKDVNLIKSSRIIDNDRTVYAWECQIMEICTLIEEYSSKMNLTEKILQGELPRKVAFFNHGYRNFGISNAEWEQLLKNDA